MIKNALVSAFVAFFATIAVLTFASTVVVPPINFDRMKHQTVKVYVEVDGKMYGHGAGVITNEGILTAGHVVSGTVGKDNQQIKVEFYNGEIRDAEIKELSIDKDEEHRFTDDLATLSVESIPEGYSTAQVSCETLPVGSEIITVGHPQLLEWATTVGRVFSTKARDGFETDHWIQMDMTATHGNSGGPVFNKRGQVVGIMSHGMIKMGVGSDTGFMFGASGPQVCEFL